MSLINLVENKDGVQWVAISQHMKEPFFSTISSELSSPHRALDNETIYITAHCEHVICLLHFQTKATVFQTADDAQMMQMMLGHTRAYSRAEPSAAHNATPSNTQPFASVNGPNVYISPSL